MNSQDRKLKEPVSPLSVIDPARFRQAMRQPASAVAIVSAAGAEGWTGITATAVCSISDMPASVLVCVNRSSSSKLSSVIAASRHFCLSYLTAEHAELADVFAGRTGLRGADRFLGSCWSTSPVGAPILDDALAGFACVLERSIDDTTHTLFIGRVVDAAYRDAAEPLVYHRGSYGTAVPLAP